MANVGNFDKQKMHTQLVGKANFRDLTSREDVLRYRKINYSLILASVILLGYTILRIRFGINELAIWSGAIGGILLLVLLFRLGFIRKKTVGRRTKKNQTSHTRSVNRTRNKPRRSSHRSREHSRRRK